MNERGSAGLPAPAPEGMLLVNRSGEIVVANSEALHSFGYTLDELMLLHIGDLLPDERAVDYARLVDGSPSAPPSAAPAYPIFGLRKGGVEIPVELTRTVVVVEGVSHALVSVIDLARRLREQATEAAARDMGLLRKILVMLPVSVITTDRAGVIVSANPAAELLLRSGFGGLLGLGLSEIHGLERARDEFGGVIWRRNEGFGEVTYHRRDGSSVPVNEDVVELPGDSGGYMVVAYDITEQIQRRRQLEHMLTHDPLTDLPNRVDLMDRLDEILERCRRDGRQAAVAVLDLDHFKRVNDTLGHEFGDHLLQRVADCLAKATRAGDLVARLGGDEFVIALIGLTGSTDLSTRVAELRTALAAPIDIHGYELTVTASVGAARFPHDGDSADTLLRYADAAMYAAKESARGSVQWFDRSMLEELTEKVGLSRALPKALAEGELHLAYQPQYSLQDGRLVGFEALARWDSPEFGPVSPNRFIPVAEDGGLILPLGEWVMRRACVDLLAIEGALGTKLTMAVNVSPLQMKSRGWSALVASTLAELGVDPYQFSLEITEGVLMDDQRSVVETVRDLRDLGVTIVVDDFGRGYSSLAYLTRFPVAKMKIDKRFVGLIGTEGTTSVIVDTIVAMAHALGMTVVAEGVETREQEQYLRAVGCEEVQGFLYGAAVSVEEAAKLPLQISDLAA